MNTKTAFTSGYQRREKNRQSRPTKTWMEEIKITAGELLFGKTEQNGDWRRLHSLSNSFNLVRLIKSRALRLAEHVVRMEESTSAFKIITGKHTVKRILCFSVPFVHFLPCVVYGGGT